MLNVEADSYLSSWYDDERSTRVVYALKRNGITVRLFCSVENFKILNSGNGRLPDDCAKWAVVNIDEPAFIPGPYSGTGTSSRTFTPSWSHWLEPSC